MPTLAAREAQAADEAARAFIKRQRAGSAVLAVDPSSVGAHTGVALWAGGTLRLWGTLDQLADGDGAAAAPYEHKVQSVLASVAHSLPGVRGLYVVVEDQYLGINPQSMIRVVEARCAWAVCASLQGLPVCLVLPAVWQSRVCPRIKGHNALALATARTAALVAGCYVESDVASAICIGMYAEGVLRLGELPGSGLQGQKKTGRRRRRGGRSASRFYLSASS